MFVKILWHDVAWDAYGDVQTNTELVYSLGMTYLTHHGHYESDELGRTDHPG